MRRVNRVLFKNNTIENWIDLQIFGRVNINQFHTDTNIRFTEHDEYFRYDKNEAEEDKTIVSFGISDYAQSQLGDIVFVDLPTVGQSFAANDQIAGVESVKAASDINIPVEGIVSEVNIELENDPSLINKDAQGNGWFFKFTVCNLDEIEKNSMPEDEYLSSKKD